MTRCLLFAALLILLSSCRVGPDFEQPEMALPIAFASKVSAVRQESPHTAWWELLRDQELNQLIRQTLSHNRDLKAAEARLLEVRALWRETQWRLLPTINAFASNEEIRNGSTAFGAAFRGRDFALYSTGFDSSWELDFFGRSRNAIRAGRATTEQADALRQQILLTLMAETAIHYVELRGFQAQLEVARNNARNQEESLNVAKVSLQGGRGNKLDVARAEALWKATLAQLPTFEEGIARASHRLAVLGGQTPDQLRTRLAKPRSLPNVPGSIPLASPTDLLRQRPDIRTAEKQLEADTARIGIAVADLFPRVTFNGRFGVEADSLKGLSGPASDAWNFGPRLSWAALDLGRVRQQIRASKARTESTLASYEQTVLNALEEAENALTSFDREQARLRLLSDSSRSANEAADLAKQRYQDGVADFLAVLDAQRVALAAENDIVISRTRLLGAWVQIYKAFGGGV